MKKEITTIKISKELVSELSKLKVHPRQSYEEVIVKALEDYKEGKKDQRTAANVKQKDITTIKISKAVVGKLSKLKVHPRQSYEEVIVKAIEAYKKNE